MQTLRHSLRRTAPGGRFTRLLAAGFIAFCLLALQHFQVGHELSHLKQGLVQDESMCVTCVALKALDGGNLVASAAMQTLAPPACPEPSLTSTPPALQATSPYQSRAPPVSFA